MVDVRGSAVPGYATTGPPDLPRPKKGPRRAHRPWCCDCKNTVDSGKDLDSDGRCGTCGHLAVRRAEAAARRGPVPPAAAPTGTPQASRTGKLTDAQRAEVVRRYVAGESGTALARTYSVSTPTVYALLARNGIQTRPRGKTAARTTTSEEPLS